MPGALDLLDQLTSDTALEAFVAAWRAGTLPRTAWTHAAHVAVCAWHAWPATPREALLAQLRAGIVAYNTAVGIANTATSGYHETLTRFWCERVAAHQAEAQAATRLAAVRGAVETFGDRPDLHTAYYDFGIVRDVRARAIWIAPNGVTN